MNLLLKLYHFKKQELKREKLRQFEINESMTQINTRSNASSLDKKHAKSSMLNHIPKLKQQLKATTSFVVNNTRANSQNNQKFSFEKIINDYQNDL